MTQREAEEIRQHLTALDDLLQSDIAQDGTRCRETMYRAGKPVKTRVFDFSDAVTVLVEISDALKAGAGMTQNAAKRARTIEAAAQWHRPAKGEIEQDAQQFETDD